MKSEIYLAKGLLTAVYGGQHLTVGLRKKKLEADENYIMKLFLVLYSLGYGYIILTIIQIEEGDIGGQVASVGKILTKL
jgi:hypothetical protein